MKNIITKYVKFTNNINESFHINSKEFDEIIDGYLECSLWTDEYDGDDYAYTIYDFIDTARSKTYSDIRKFIHLAGEDAISEAIDENGYSKLGHDIWLTRNHHGAGFFDHNYTYEKQLMGAAHTLKEETLVYLDGVVTFESLNYE